MFYLFFLLLFPAMAGLRPGLLQKYQNAVTADEKFALLKAFMLDPVSMADVTTEMRLYWVFREGSGVSKQSREVGTKVTGKGSVPANKAARAAIADTLVGRAAEFSRKGAPSADSGKGSKGKTKTGKAGGKTKSTSTRKAGVYAASIDLSHFCETSLALPGPY